MIKKIEVFLRQCIVKNIPFEIAFNVNAVYDYLKINKYSMAQVDTSAFKNYFTKSDIKNLLDENKMNNALMNCYGNHFEYRRSLPIIALGTLNVGMFDGTIINGNHRMAGKISSDENTVTMYLVDCTNRIPNEFFLNDDYRKIVHVVNSLNELN